MCGEKVKKYLNNYLIDYIPIFMQDSPQKSISLNHQIKLILFVQMKNCFGSCKYSLGDMESRYIS